MMRWSGHVRVIFSLAAGFFLSLPSFLPLALDGWLVANLPSQGEQVEGWMDEVRVRVAGFLV